MAVTFASARQLITDQKWQPMLDVISTLNDTPTNAAHTWSALQDFAQDMLRVLNSGGTFGHKMRSLATAARTATWPDASGTVALVGTTTSATAPTAATGLASPAFTGTGMTAAGQVMTSTDNQTMTLNQCAGMWLVCATHGPYLIASNTAVTGAPAVLTIYGTAPTTDAGTYKVLGGPSHTHTNG